MHNILFLFSSSVIAAAATFAKRTETQMPARGVMQKMIDLQEARACLDEHRIALANICGMLKPVVAEGGLGEALGKLNQKLIEKLNDQEKDAAILSIIILEEMKETRDQLMDFPGEFSDLFVALNQLSLEIGKVAEARVEYFRKTAEANDVKAKGTEADNPVSIAIAEFKRSIGWMSDEEVQEEIDMLAKKAELISNTPDRIEICAAAETDASGNEAGREIRIERLESPTAENPGEECGARADTMDDTETILNWLVDLDRTSLLAALSNEAEAAQRLVRSGRQRTASAKHREALDYLDRVNRILSFFRDGNIAAGMSEHELSLCKSFEDKMPVRGPS
jgi:hypothetical protein